MTAYNATKGLRIAAEVELADTASSRSKGLLGRDGLEPGHALHIVPCPMIHTFFMRFAIDVLFLDKGGKVLRVMENLKPWRLSPWVLGAHSVLELPAGALAGGTARGDTVEFR